MLFSIGLHHFTFSPTVSSSVYGSEFLHIIAYTSYILYVSMFLFAYFL